MTWRQREKRNAGRERGRPRWVRGSGCGGRTDRDPMTAEWEPQQCVSTETAGQLSAAILAPDKWRSTTQNCGP